MFMRTCLVVIRAGFYPHSARSMRRSISATRLSSCFLSSRRALDFVLRAQQLLHVVPEIEEFLVLPRLVFPLDTTSADDPHAPVISRSR